MLQAADAGVPNLTFFPGAQFILAGLVAGPDDYYFEVPVMRMVLDLVVYLGMLTALGLFVLFHATPLQLASCLTTTTSSTGTSDGKKPFARQYSSWRVSIRSTYITYFGAQSIAAAC